MEKKIKEQWFSDEWFWETYGPLMFDQNRMAETPEEVAGIIRLANPPEGSSILDCCCGLGRHTIEMAARNFKMTGLDLSEGYLKRARQEAENRHVDVNWQKMDAREISFQEEFDGIINMFTSFGYFEDPDDDLLLLQKLHKSLKPGGFLFMEMTGKEVLARDFEERVWFESGGLKILLEYAVDLNWTELRNRWLFLDQGNLTEYTFSHRIFSAAEMARLLWEAGFAMVEVFGDFDGRLYDHQANRLILVAHKAL